MRPSTTHKTFPGPAATDYVDAFNPWIYSIAHLLHPYKFKISTSGTSSLHPQLSGNALGMNEMLSYQMNHTRTLVLVKVNHCARTTRVQRWIWRAQIDTTLDGSYMTCSCPSPAYHYFQLLSMQCWCRLFTLFVVHSSASQSCNIVTTVVSNFIYAFWWWWLGRLDNMWGRWWAEIVEGVRTNKYNDAE